MQIKVAKEFRLMTVLGLVGLVSGGAFQEERQARRVLVLIVKRCEMKTTLVETTRPCGW